ncbi:myopalladin isoform X3 [Triplophysa dalaica]|uniref:myopalladin isoform X3 n=1 Tax=Triplophysa dalaica TaxID=1582913 RepID=UPI0024DFECAF|nr:myopalladin isoform X3 [Triplophysa dalaica]
MLLLSQLCDGVCFTVMFSMIISRVMQDQTVDQPTSLSQLLRDSYLSDAHHRHAESSCLDSPRRLVYGAVKEKADPSAERPDAPFPDLSAFLSQEELDKSVDLASKAFSHEHKSEGHHSSVPSDKLAVETPAQPCVRDKSVRNIRTSREPPPDFKRPSRNAPYGVEPQSKKEFLNKAADFIEELSSLFKANSSKRIRPRSCKGHRSRHQNKAQLDASSYSSHSEDRERANEQPLESDKPMDGVLEKVCMEEEEPLECPCESQREKPEEPAMCEPPQFIQKLKSREVPEGSKVQMDCVVRGLPTPEIRWFCEGKELENSPDIQIISIRDRHSLIIAEAFEEDTGRYSCFASNFCGTDSTSAEIYIEGASSSDSEGEQHLPAQLHNRSPPPQTDVISETPDTFLQDSTPTLTISSLEQQAASASHTQMTFDPEDTEHLTCVFISPQIAEQESTSEVQQTALIEPTPTESPASPPDTSDTLLTSQQSNTEDLNGSSSFLQSFDVRPIMAVPVFTKNLQDEVLAQEGQLVVLECQVKGVPSPKVDWYREGTLIDDSPDFRILQKKPRSMAESEEMCTLVIAEVFPEDSGTFTCTASNKYGTVSSIAGLRVKGCNNKSSKATSLMTESCHQKVPATSSLKCEDVPLLNHKLHSSVLSLDPLRSGSTQSDTQSNGSGLRHDLTTSLPNLNPLSIGQLHSDTFRSSLPRLDSLSFSVPQFELMNSDSKHRPLKTFSSHIDSGDSGFKSSTDVTQCLPNGSASTFSSDVVSWVEPLQNVQVGSKSSPDPPPEDSSNHHERPPLNPQPDPPTSCLKTRSERLLVNHNESRSSSRVGLRVTFKLPEDEEDEEKSNKAPPPVLAKPKLDPVQLQILHNQVLLEQQQGKVSPSQESPHSDSTSFEAPFVMPLQSSSNSGSSQLRTPRVMNSTPVPQLISASVPVQPLAPVPQLSASLPLLSTLANALFNNPQTPQPNLVSNALLNSIPHSVVPSSFITQTTVMPLPAPQIMSPVTQLNMAPLAPMPFSPLTAAPPIIPLAQSNQFIPAFPTQPNTNSMFNMPPLSPPTHISQRNMNPTPQMNSVPFSETVMTVVKTQPPITPDAAAVNNTVTKVNTTPVTRPVTLIQDTKSQSVAWISKVTSPQVLNGPSPAPVSVPPLNSTTQPPLPAMIPISTQSFSYTRPKDFIAAQTLSPLRSPSPTESPVPMLHELAAQIFPKSTRQQMSPVNQFAPSQRKLPTRILECPRSPPAFMSSPPLVPPGLVFAFRPQSPPQASSPTSSSSSPSPIQNPVAFLSSVLPSLPTSPPTNAMGLPKRAPLGPQGALKKNPRGLRTMSEDDIRDSRETLLQDIEKKLQLKNESFRFGQQEYKMSNFEQRLLSEIEFRLERTPVEESDEEVQHDEIPSGRCIAPIFDKKLKHFRAVEGAPVTFTCKVVGIPVPKVYWFKDGTQILKKNQHYQKIREGDGTCSLHIEAAGSDDDGNYTVMAANPQGRISCSGHLIVQTGPVRNRPVVHSQRVRARVQEVEGELAQERFFRPHFLQAPGDMFAHEGRVCRLDCKVSGLPHPEIMWLLNGRPIYPDVSHRMLVRENGVHSLVIDPLTQADDGTYTCIASNKAGQSSFCLELRVVEKEMKQAPQFVEKLQNTGVAEGAPLRLECRVIGMPQPVIYWKKDNDTISHSKERLSMHQDATGYVCLLIQPTRKEDAGWYTVSAKNEAGITSCTARLDIYAQWYQHVHPPMRKTQLTGSCYAALSHQGLDIKSAFSTCDGGPVMFSACRSESEQL